MSFLFDLPHDSEATPARLTQAALRVCDLLGLYRAELARDAELGGRPLLLIVDAGRLAPVLARVERGLRRVPRRQ